jgi:hypothetical protein
LEEGEKADNSGGVLEEEEKADSSGGVGSTRRQINRVVTAALNRVRILGFRVAAAGELRRASSGYRGGLGWRSRPDGVRRISRLGHGRVGGDGLFKRGGGSRTRDRRKKEAVPHRSM